MEIRNYEINSFKKIFTSKAFVPIGIFTLGFTFIAFFINCSMNMDEELNFSSEVRNSSNEALDFLSVSMSQEEINKNCNYELNNGCHSGTLNDTPDINRTLKWQCVGEDGGVTADCEKPNTGGVVCSSEGYCLNVQGETLPETQTHTWIKCDEDGTITHCSVPKEDVVDGYCNNNEINGCLGGTLNDTPDINRTFRWQCVGENGGVTADCEKPNTFVFVCGLERYCLDGEFEDLPGTATHNWFQCTEENGTITHCSTPEIKMPVITPVCPPDKVEPHYKAVGNQCLPSCGIACKNSSASGTCANGRPCSDILNYGITPITHTYQTPCCKRESKSLITPSVCPPYKVEPHYKAVGNQCLPSCGIACKNSSASGTCANGSPCSDTLNYEITPITHTYQTPCCKRESKSLITPSVCPPYKVEPHYKAVGDQCLPSCGHACTLSNASGSCASGNSCNDTANYDITVMGQTYGGSQCCKRTAK